MHMGILHGRCQHRIFWGFQIMANHFVRTSSAGSANGNDWSNAWSITNLNSNWASVAAGDTVWLAGGSYSTGITMTKSGTAGNVITLKRATANDSAATGAAGWSAGFDAQVVITASPTVQYNSTNNGSYTAIDGNVEDGIKLVHDAASFNGDAIYFASGGMHDISFSNLDMAGPGGATTYNYTADASVIGVRHSDTATYNMTVTDCKLHGNVNLVYDYTDSHEFTFLRCKFYDNGSSNGSFHANMVYTSGGIENWVFADCEFYNWQVEGINLYEQPAPDHSMYIYGCLFHDPMESGARCMWLASEPSGGTPQGPVHLVNNTFYGVNITVNESRASNFGSTSLCKNNIFWNSSFGSASPLPTGADYNFSSGSTSGAHSISSGSDPFVSGSDFHIIATIGAAYPRDKGVDAGSPYGTDMDGIVRGGDGTWDIGAYEFDAGGGGDPGTGGHGRRHKRGILRRM